MKKYRAFMGESFYPLGGMNDFVKDFDSIDEAVSYLTRRARKVNWHLDLNGVDDPWYGLWFHVIDRETDLMIKEKL